ncbi:SAM-dependent methyltransferase [Candidatus Hepatincolaceae symbiont of Richtersius coronifer]
MQQVIIDIVNNYYDPISKQQGAMPLDRFLQLALSEESLGYYKIKDPFSSINSTSLSFTSLDPNLITPLGVKNNLQGDFITSPETSQIFGELIGVWLLDTWQTMGCPSAFNLIELGGGTGRLMQDVLRVINKLSAIAAKALKIYIIDINPLLIKQQAINLKDFSHIYWHLSIEAMLKDKTYLASPTFIISNEFFDALPIKQYVYLDNCFYENLVYFNPKIQQLQLKHSLIATNFASQGKTLEAPLDKLLKQFFSYQSSYQESKEITPPILEFSPKAHAIYQQLLNIIKIQTGAILTIDYGPFKPTFKSSLRGFKTHRLLDTRQLLQQIGEADITANVNFFCLQELAKANKTNTFAIQTQRQFLEGMGIYSRIATLMNNALTENDKKSIQEAADLLINKADMGEVFKVVAVASPCLNALATFTPLIES